MEARLNIIYILHSLYYDLFEGERKGTVANNDIFAWSDGSPWDYESWAVSAGQPDDHEGEDDCVGKWKKHGLKWADYVCDYEFPFVCKRGLYKEA